MTPEEVREKYGIKEDRNEIDGLSFKKGYVFCSECPATEHCRVHDGCEGYEECWEEIARFTGWRPEEETQSAADSHKHPYQGKYECIDEMIALFGVQAVKDFCRCNVYKYRFRADRKNGEEDIKKAEWYMEKLMELEKQ